MTKTLKMMFAAAVAVGALGAVTEVQAMPMQASVATQSNIEKAYVVCGPYRCFRRFPYYRRYYYRPRYRYYY